MPSFLATLTAALLFRQHNASPVVEAQGPPPRVRSLPSTDVDTLQNDEAGEPPSTLSNNVTEEHLATIPSDGKKLPPSTVNSNVARYSPAGSMAVACSLFLLGRCESHPECSSPRSIRRLPVRLNLRAENAVQIQQYDDSSIVQYTSITDMSEDVSGEVSKRHNLHVDLSYASDLRGSNRHITIVTTAALPWMTGTSVNPTLRAVYLAKDGHDITLVVPWLSTLEEQRKIFSKGSPLFEKKDQQARYILDWACTHVKNVVIDVRFYEGVYSDDLGSIMPVGAITDVFSDEALVKDVCILEEPEHLTWHHAGEVWTEIFNLVVGIIHTNYIEYAKKYGFFGPQKALALLFLNAWVCRGYCHRIIKLSDAVQEFPNSITSNVHGVQDRFLRIGRSRRGKFPRGAYFMGKVLWAKGYCDLIDHLKEHFNTTQRTLPIDLFGSGPDVLDVESTIRTEAGLSAVALHAGVADHSGEWLQGYKVFVNASKSDVVCTATAEALAMGKFVICLDHASNEFFATFPNCLTYTTTEEFSAAVDRALSTEPQTLSSKDTFRLSWEAATERLYDAVRLPLWKRRPSKVDLALGSAHATLSRLYPQPGKNIRRAIEEDYTQSNRM